MKLSIIPFVVLIAFACSKPEYPRLKEVWESDAVLKTPESVLYDGQREVLYVTNINENPWEKDGNGFISKMDVEGNILVLEWVSGLHGPKGMGILNNMLYVADIDEIVEIDIESGTIVNRFLVSDNPTLNDITIGNGSVFISGSDSNKVFELKDGTVTEILNDDFGRPNGLYWEPERLLMLTSRSNTLKSIDLASGETTDLVGELGAGDGIVPTGDGYLTSNWLGEVFYISPDWEKTQLLDTRKEKINAADIDYVVEKNLLLVPTFLDNRVVAYELIMK